MLPSARPGQRARRALVAATVAVALSVSAAGCSRSPRAAHPARSAAAQSTGGTGRPADAAAATAANPVPPVPGAVMLGEYLDLSGRTPDEAMALRHDELGRDPRIVHRFYQWTDELPDHPDGLPDGGVLMLSWAGTSYRTILDGSQDALIARAADAMTAYHDPLFVRWAWEMNGDWHPWGGAGNGGDPASFVSAWRHIHDIFAAHHATNVAWVWAPNWNSNPDTPWNDVTRYYPGDEYVDWVGVSGYMVDYRTCSALFGPVYAKFSDRKPIMIAETSALETDPATKQGRIRELATWVVRHPAVSAVVWFDTDTDRDSGQNWRVDSSPDALEAYRQLGLDPYFGG